MGVGKTATCRALMRKLDRAVFLDGDWCWEIRPFRATEETKRMVMENICFLLNNFIRCSAYENILFCWVLHEQAILGDLLARLNTAGCRVHTISLVCGKAALRARLRKNVEAGIRTEDIIPRSIDRIPLYDGCAPERWTYRTSHRSRRRTIFCAIADFCAEKTARPQTADKPCLEAGYQLDQKASDAGSQVRRGLSVHKRT